MKKNITINLAGQLFAIDEDAYSLLLNYTETLRRYYRRQDEGEEVVDDIESRIAELFCELLEKGYNAITIEHVQSVIERIGSLEDITEGNADDDASRTNADNQQTAFRADEPRSAADNVRGAWNKIRSGKRFYRDMENKMLAGVLAGCSKYFGGDVVIWRIAFLCLMLIPLPFIGECTGTLVFIYLIMAIISPAASTPEERLKMRGEEVTPQNLADEVNRESTESSANAARAQRRHTFNIICAILLILFSVWMWLGAIGVLCGAGAVMIVPQFMAEEIFDKTNNAPVEAINTVIYSIFYILAAVELCVVVLAYCSLHTGLFLLDKVKAMGLKERITWLIVWVVSVVCIVMASMNCAAKIRNFERNYPNAHDIEIVASPTLSDSVSVDSVATSATPDSLTAKTDTLAAKTDSLAATKNTPSWRNKRSSRKHR